MVQPTLQQAFGETASITNGDLKIKLSEIYPGGVSPTSPSAESILVAILQHYHGVSDSGDEAEVVVTRTTPTTLSQGANNYVTQQYSVIVKQEVSLDISRL